MCPGDSPHWLGSAEQPGRHVVEGAVRPDATSATCAQVPQSFTHTTRLGLGPPRSSNTTPDNTSAGDNTSTGTRATRRPSPPRPPTRLWVRALVRAAEHGLARVARPSCVPPLLCGPGCLPPRSSQPHARCQQSPARQNAHARLAKLRHAARVRLSTSVGFPGIARSTHGRPSPRASRVARAKPCASHPHARAQGSSTRTMAR